jgi:hypothetical protein
MPMRSLNALLANASWIATAASSAWLTLPNAARKPSPVVLNRSPAWRWIVGTTTSDRAERSAS